MEYYCHWGTVILMLALPYLDVMFSVRSQPIPEPMLQPETPVEEDQMSPSQSQDDIQPDADDRCPERHNVQPGETCNNIATLHGLRVDQLLLLNPGIACRPFYSGANLCVDERVLEEILNDARNSQDFRMLSPEEMNYNIANADTAAVQGDPGFSVGYPDQQIQRDNQQDNLPA